MPASYRIQGFDAEIEEHDTCLVPRDCQLLHSWVHLLVDLFVHVLVFVLVQVDHQEALQLVLLEVLNFLRMNVVVPTDLQVPLSEESLLHVLMAVDMDFASAHHLVQVPLSLESLLPLADHSVQIPPSLKSLLPPNHELILVVDRNQPPMSKDNQRQVFP